MCLVKICGWINSKCTTLEGSTDVKSGDIKELSGLVAEITLQFGHNFQGRSLAATGIAISNKNVDEIVSCLRNLRNALINLLADRYQYLNIDEEGCWQSKSIKPTEASALSKKLNKASIPLNVSEILYGKNVVLKVLAAKPELIVKALQEVIASTNSSSISEVRKLI
ncbi:hypothetical protein EAH77_15435 [Ewingella americana]|uniref:Uncharacterized protein n=2 Tax=Ewingella americana TaxID=41202 RepID=A0A502GEJ0_9GAMM|nr:hypothetical protein EAH77_15435 [Ewingella americana]